MSEEIENPITKEKRKFFASDPCFFTRLDAMIYDSLSKNINDVDLFLLLRYNICKFIDDEGL